MGHAISCLTAKPVYPETQTPKTTAGHDVRPSSTGVAALPTNCSLDQLRGSIRVPLSEREVFIITKSWKAISRNMTHTGIAMFLRYRAARTGIKHMRSEIHKTSQYANSLWTLLKT